MIKFVMKWFYNSIYLWFLLLCWYYRFAIALIKQWSGMHRMLILLSYRSHQVYMFWINILKNFQILRNHEDIAHQDSNRSIEFLYTCQRNVLVPCCGMGRCKKLKRKYYGGILLLLNIFDSRKFCWEWVCRIQMRVVSVNKRGKFHFTWKGSVLGKKL